MEAERKKPRILVVDDEETIRKSLKKRLEKEGYEVLTAENGEEALSFLERDPFQLLITDYRMKGIDGLQLLRRARESWRGLPVIVITGTSSMDIQPEDFIREGALDCLIKPIPRERILEAVSRAIGKERPKEEAP